MKTKLSASIIQFTFFIAGATLMLGCLEEEDSCNIRTPGIYTEYYVSEIDGQASVNATFWVGDGPQGTYLELGSCGDTIEVNGIKLNETGSYPTHYTAKMPAATEYVFAFIRPKEKAYYSVMDNVPGAIHIETPQGEQIARDEDLLLLWQDNGNSQISLNISSGCFTYYRETLTDDGRHIVPANTFATRPQYCTKGCAATATLTRKFSGRLSPSLKGTIGGEVKSHAYFDTIAGQNEVPYQPDTETDTEVLSDTQ